MPNSSEVSQKGASVEMNGFAIKALSVLASDIGIQPRQAPPSFLEDFQAAATNPDRTKLHEIMDKMQRAGVQQDDIAGRYIPSAARYLGDEWLADRSSFAEVTIGSARLQGLLHQLGPVWCGENIVAPPDAPHCLVIVPDGEQHTLGATILAGQLRRQGVAVQLELNVDPKAARSMARRGTYSGIMISSTPKINLDKIGTLVDTLRPGNGDVPIVIGGSVLEQCSDLGRATGADYATSDWQEALHICNTHVRHQTGAFCAQQR